MKTGLEKLDNIIHSLNCGELTCIASRPGLGKTTLLIDIVNNVSKNTDNKRRFAIDENIITSKFKTMFGYGKFNELWYMTSYEAKCEFIQRYVDKITIKKYDDKNNRIASVELVDLKIKPHRVSELLDYDPKGNFDKIMGKDFLRTSYAEMKYEKDVLEYVELLREKYKIGVTEKVDNSCLLSPTLFKHIKINPVKAIEKEKDLYLFFLGPREYEKGVAQL